MDGHRDTVMSRSHSIFNRLKDDKTRKSKIINVHKYRMKPFHNEYFVNNLVAIRSIMKEEAESLLVMTEGVTEATNIFMYNTMERLKRIQDKYFPRFKICLLVYFGTIVNKQHNMQISSMCI